MSYMEAVSLTVELSAHYIAYKLWYHNNVVMHSIIRQSCCCEFIFKLKFWLIYLYWWDRADMQSSKNCTIMRCLLFQFTLILDCFAFFSLWLGYRPRFTTWEYYTVTILCRPKFLFLNMWEVFWPIWVWICIITKVQWCSFYCPILYMTRSGPRAL